MSGGKLKSNPDRHFIVSRGGAAAATVGIVAAGAVFAPAIIPLALAILSVAWLYRLFSEESRSRSGADREKKSNESSNALTLLSRQESDMYSAYEPYYSRNWLLNQSLSTPESPETAIARRAPNMATELLSDRDWMKFSAHVTSELCNLKAVTRESEVFAEVPVPTRNIFGRHVIRHVSFRVSGIKY